MKLRPYQQEIFDDITRSEANDLVQLDTGAGKTPIQAALAARAPYCLLVAHRNILITQISEKLAAFGLEHDTISTEHTRRRCMATHRQHGRNYIRRGCNKRLVASIDSLAAQHRRGLLSIDTSIPWLIIIDEAHHVVPDNKWGSLRKIFPNARIVGFTATPARHDGESLHIRNGGLFDRLVQAESLKEDSVSKLISQGYLSDFKVFSPPIGHGHVFRDGPAGKTDLLIAGDPVKWYKRLANGKRAVAMCPSIKNAEEFAEEFKAAGIPATCISSKQSAVDVAFKIDQFVAGRVMVLCNVDMVGEGFDVPGIEAMIMLRKTASFVAYRQWIGRALRPAPGKAGAIIIDHVGNVPEHGMPDEHVKWDLLNPPRGLASIRHAPCSECHFMYPIKLRFCPECEAENELHTRGVIGGHYVNISRLDFALVEQAKREYTKAQYEKRLEREIVWPYFGDGGDLIGRTITSLRKLFVESIKNGGAPLRDINMFLESQECKSREFWIQNFTAKDAATMCGKKAEKVFAAWQKSL